jgi:hypothetical protein
MIVEEKFKKKLLVEGNDDQHVVWALCQKFELEENFDIIDCNSISNLILQIPVRIKESGVETIGVIIDADTDLTARWNSLATLLKKQDYIIPTFLPEEGLIISQPGKPKIGIWVMPDNKIAGMLEDFISFLIPADDKLKSIAVDTLNSIETEEVNKYSLIHKSKALIHTWLAWQENPGTPMGLAITKRYLTTDHAKTILFINWLTKLFIA